MLLCWSVGVTDSGMSSCEPHTLKQQEQVRLATVYANDCSHARPPHRATPAQRLGQPAEAVAPISSFLEELFLSRRCQARCGALYCLLIICYFASIVLSKACSFWLSRRGKHAELIGRIHGRLMSRQKSLLGMSHLHHMWELDTCTLSISSYPCLRGACSIAEGAGLQVGAERQKASYTQVPENVIWQSGLVFDIVTSTSHRCNCFTRTYTQFAKVRHSANLP